MRRIGVAVVLVACTASGGGTPVDGGVDGGVDAEAGAGQYALGGVCPVPDLDAGAAYPHIVCDRGTAATPRFAPIETCLREAGATDPGTLLTYAPIQCTHPDGEWASRSCPPVPFRGLEAYLIVCTYPDAVRAVERCRADAGTGC